MSDGRSAIGSALWDNLAYKKSDIGLILTIILGGFLASFSLSLVNISLPSILITYSVGTSLASWVLLFPFLLDVSFGLVIGKIGDTIGLKRVFIWGIVIFIVGSFFCGTSVGIYMLIASRGIQAIGISMFLTVGIAIFFVHLHKDLQGKAMGYFTALESLGAVTGFFVGGLINEHFGWQWAFLMTIPMGCIVLLIASFVMPKDEKRDEHVKLDIFGAALIMASFFAITFCFSMGKELGWTSPIVMGCLIIFFFGLAAFIAREKKIAEPLVDISLFKNSRFISANLVGFFINLAITGCFFLIPLYLGVVFRLDSENIGLIMALSSVPILITAPIAGYLIDRFEAGKVCAAGTITAAVSLFLFSNAVKEASPDSILYIAVVLLGTSFGLVFPANARLMLGSCPTSKKGSATSVSGMFLGLAGLFGTVLFETALTLAPITEDNRFLEFRELPLADQVAGAQSAFTLGFISCLVAVIVAYWAAKKYGCNYDAPENGLD
jgi:EmrB/QacA subfamily drug resistance transporter